MIADNRTTDGTRGCRITSFWSIARGDYQRPIVGPNKDQLPPKVSLCNQSVPVVSLFVCLFVYSRLSNFSAIRRLSPLPLTGLQI
jgi:hypothetical protein